MTTSDPRDRFDPPAESPDDDLLAEVTGEDPSGIRSTGTTEIVPGVDDATGSPGVAMTDDSGSGDRRS
jgi:hypothetical protein